MLVLKKLSGWRLKSAQSTPSLPGPGSSLFPRYNWDMGVCPDDPDLINLFALVTYLPDPLRQCLNDLRRELVPGCHLKAHLTVLPPRALFSRKTAWEQLLLQTADQTPINVELGGILIFPKTNVIHVSIRKGRESLISLHDLLARDALFFDEPFDYHPHITLAQGLPEPDVAAAAALARRRWEEYRGPRGFTLDSMTFVQSTGLSDWVDLGEVALGEVRATAS